jgi:hypothetical protein
MKTIRNIAVVAIMLAFVFFRPAPVKADGCLHSCVLACEADERQCEQSACSFATACHNNCDPSDSACNAACDDDYTYLVGECQAEEDSCYTDCGC